MASAFVTLVVGALVLLVLYLMNRYTFWKRRGIPTAKGIVPVLGHTLPLLTLRMSFSDFNRKVYDSVNSSMIGFYRLTTPLLLLRDPQLVKTVMQSSFSNFHENGWVIQPDADPLLAKNPFFCYGDAWVTGRKRLTYAFSNVRLKILFESVSEVCKKMEDFLNRRLQSQTPYEVELKYLFSKFTGEVVASAGMGIEGFCFEDKPTSMPVYELGNMLFDQSLLRSITNILMFFVPSFNRMMKLSFVPKAMDKYFRHIVSENLEIRRKSQVTRNDFLQLMIELEKTEGEKLDEEALAAHILSFFVDGYETSSMTLSFAGYNLAVNPEIQQKLRDEILSTIAKHDGALTFDALKEMTYMDRVINESQRYYPSVGVLLKRCTQEYELTGSDGLTCRMQPGMEVVVPIHALHMDSRYWEDPEVFDPDRFDQDRKQNIEKMTFLPFGEGPRICVGMRMALLQMKACLATLLRNYKLELSPKTRVPLKLSSSHFLSSPVGGIWVRISKI